MVEQRWIVRGTLVIAALFAMQVGALAQASRQLLFGADFDPKASAQVRERFFETGMNCVRMTGGGYGWAAAMHKALAEDFQSRGLKVYMQLGSHYPSAEYFDRKDDWLVDEAG